MADENWQARFEERGNFKERLPNALWFQAAGHVRVGRTTFRQHFPPRILLILDGSLMEFLNLSQSKKDLAGFLRYVGTIERLGGGFA